MKKLVLLLTFTLFYSLSFSQNNLKQITIKDKANDIVEKYSVLKESREIKQGQYKKFLNGNLIETGQYSENEKTGVWKYYGYKEKLELEYNIDNNKVLSYDQFEQNDSLDRSVIFLGSTYVPRRIIQMNLRYPVEAQENGKSGRIIISILIDETGKIYDYEIKQKVYSALDDEALRVVKLITGEWLPAIYKGKEVKGSIDFPIVFQ